MHNRPNFNANMFALLDPLACGREAHLGSPVFVEFEAARQPGADVSGKARLRSISSLMLGSEPAWEDCSELAARYEFDGVWFAGVSDELAVVLAERISEGRSDLALCALVREMAPQEDAWDDFRDALQENRFEANVWFERDRKNVRLTDGLTSRDVVCLWDDDVDSAIDAGLLCAPSRARPADSDWLQPLLDYADATGALNGLTVENPRSAHPRQRG